MVKEEKAEKLSREILRECQNGWYRRFPHMDAAFAGVTYKGSKETEKIGTDGNAFYFCPEFLLRTFSRCPEKVRRGYLHMLLHCLFLHVIREEQYDENLWNLACDMAVEQILERELGGQTGKTGERKPGSQAGKIGERKPGSQTGKTGELGGQSSKTEAEYRSAQIRSSRLEEMRSGMGGSLSAEQIYCGLAEGKFSFDTEQIRTAFYFDDHHFWRKNKDLDRAVGLRNKWEKIRSHSGQNKEGGWNRAGDESGDGKENLEQIYKSRYDYRKFLKQFAVLREEVELDMESFDYIYYSFGMEHYGNLPLIEPLEYREVNRLEELVIAIDTSGSCSAQMVSRFLGETYGILGEKENFFEKMTVHIVQCDCCIQNVAVIHSGEEWAAYSRNVQIQGRAGTDFRPVFRYIEGQREKRALKNLKALIYFTDGDGIYPQYKPDYETAFVFVKKTQWMNRVPSWAKRLVVEETNR